MKCFFTNRSPLPLPFQVRIRKTDFKISIFFIAFLLLINCAPQIITTAPPRFKEELSLEEIIAKVGDEIQTLKAVADITIEKNDELIDQVSASALIQRPDRVHMRVYKLGMLARDIVLRDRRLYGVSGKNNAKLSGLIDEFFHIVCWWYDVEGASLHSLGDEYIIRTVNKEIRVDKATLMILRQDIRLPDKTVYITYAEPNDYGGFWYPSKLVIDVGEFRFSVKIAKLIKNPLLGESDFKPPSGG